MNEDGAPLVITYPHGDSRPQPQPPFEDPSRLRVEHALLDQRHPEFVRERPRVVHVEEDLRGRVARSFHVPVGVPDAHLVGGVKDQLAAGQALCEVPQEPCDPLLSEVLEHARGDLW